ncbi:MAG: phosphoglycerate kinase [Pseudomonadota bacterium]
MGWKSIDDLEMRDRNVLVRVDINVPVEDGRVTDTTRIDRIVPTVKDILGKGGKPILMAHFGRPKGKVVAEMSLAPIRGAVEAAMGVPVGFAEDCIGAAAERAVAQLPPGEVLLLENTRFHPGEEGNDPAFAAALAALGNVYVNDAFSAAHRAHASTEALARLLPAAAGRLMEAELTALEAALGTPERPVMAVVGGAKVSTKLELLGNLVTKVDHLVIGGGMANTFLLARGVEVGTSLAEHDMADTATDILEKAETAGCRVYLPVDAAIAKKLEPTEHAQVVAIDKVAADMSIFDAGPETVDRVITALGTCRTFVMNGPLGVFEVAPYQTATFAVLDAVAKQTAAGELVSIAGGGDTVSAINTAGHGAAFSYISTAGGAFLEWMEGKTLPGVAALGPGA